MSAGRLARRRLLRESEHMPEEQKTSLPAAVKQRLWVARHMITPASREWLYWGRFYNGLERRVAAGPFAGVRLYDGEGSWSQLAPYALGSYEEELHPHIERLLATRRYTSVVDVGAAEGYYAVGLARRLPDARVIAADADATARIICGRMAQLNGVADRVEVVGAMTPAELDTAIDQRTLVLVDCEGCEYDLLRPDLAPKLRSADLVVELHDLVDPRITPAITERFADTHEMLLVQTRPRDPADYPALRRWPRRVQRRAVDELRVAPMQWAVLTSHMWPLP